MSEFSIDREGDYEDSFERREREQHDQSQDDGGDLAEYARQQLEEAQLNHLVCFNAQDCESPRAFLAALQPGDVLRIDSNLAMILKVSGNEGEKELDCLVKPNPQDSRKEGMEIQTLQISARRVSRVQEVVANRQRVSSEALQAAFDPVVQWNVGVFLHQGRDGSKFRNAGLGGGQQVIHVGVEDSSGRINGVSPDGDATDVRLTTNGFFQPSRPYIEKVEFLSKVSDEHAVQLDHAVALANAIMRVDRVGSLRSIL
jgi:hypothetical protein